MSTEANKALVRRTLEEFYNQGDVTLADEVFADKYINHDPAAPQLVGREGRRQWVEMMRAGFPGNHTTIDDLIAEGDKLVKRYTWRGTHQGEWNGIPATGKQIVVSGMTIYRIAEGKIQECWWAYDVLGALQQLGVVPVPEHIEA